MKKLLYTLIILFWASWAGATAYYVKNGGNDGAAGTSDETAWATIAKINDFAESPGFSDGDIIQLKRGSTWAGGEGIGWDGSSISWGTINGLTIQDYGEGNLPRIDGNLVRPIFISASGITNLTIKNIDCSGIDWPTAYYGNVTIYYVNGLTIDGIYIDGHKGASTYNYHEAAIKISDVDGDIEIKNCTILNMYKNTFANTVSDWGDKDSSGIFFWYNPAKTSGTVSIHDNTVNRVYSDCIAPEGIQTTTNIYNNSLYRFGENAIDSKGGQHHNIYNNDIAWYDFGSSAGEAYWGATVWVGTSNVAGNSGYHTFHDNYVHDSALSVIRLATSYPVEIYNNYFKDIGGGIIFATPMNSQKIYNNLFSMQADASTSTTAMEAVSNRVAVSLRYGSNNKIYNNTIYINSTNHNYGMYIGSGIGSGNEIKNNIVQMARNNSAVYPLYAAGSGATVQYNNWYGAHANRAYWNGTVYDSTEQADWRTAGHTGGLFSDPLFTNLATPDFTLQSTSPCINAGTDVGDTYKNGWSPATSMPTISTDVTMLNQDNYGTGWEMGTYVFGFTISLPYPTSLIQCADITPPYDATQAVTFGVTSSENATCKFSVKGTDTCATAYADLDEVFESTTDQTAHSDTDEVFSCATTTTIIVKCINAGSTVSNCLEIPITVGAGGGGTPTSAPRSIISGGRRNIVTGGRRNIN